MCHPVDVPALADCDLILKPWKKQHKINIPTMLPSLLIRFSFPSRKNKGKKTKNSILRLVSSVCIPISSDLSSDGDNVIRERTKCFPPLLLCVSFHAFSIILHSFDSPWSGRTWSDREWACESSFPAFRYILTIIRWIWMRGVCSCACVCVLCMQINPTYLFSLHIVESPCNTNRMWFLINFFLFHPYPSYHAFNHICAWLSIQGVVLMRMFMAGRWSIMNPLRRLEIIS